MRGGETASSGPVSERQSGRLQVDRRDNRDLVGGGGRCAAGDQQRDVPQRFVFGPPRGAQAVDAGDVPFRLECSGSSLRCSSRCATTRLWTARLCAQALTMVRRYPSSRDGRTGR